MAAVTAPYGAATPEEIWAILRENAAQMKAHEEKWHLEAEKRQQEAKQWQKEREEERQKEAEKRQQEAEQRQKEREEERQKEAEQWQKEREQRQKEAEKRQQEAEQRQKEREERDKKFDKKMEQLEKIVRRNGKQMGELHNKFGKLAEHLVAPGIVKRFNELGYHFNRIATKGAKIYGEQGQIKAEIDLLLENGDYIIAVEVKIRPLMKDVPHHIRRMEILREFMNTLHNTRIIRGAIAGAIFEEAEKKAVLEAGFYVIEQSGDTMKLDIPEGFVPGEW